MMAEAPDIERKKQDYLSNRGLITKDIKIYRNIVVLHVARLF